MSQQFKREFLTLCDQVREIGRLGDAAKQALEIEHEDDFEDPTASAATRTKNVRLSADLNAMTGQLKVINKRLTELQVHLGHSLDWWAGK